MSIQIRSFIDGAWITQTVDIHHLMAQNRQSRQHQRPAMPLEPPLQKPPLLGLLSQTLNQSPVAKWIIPARIRHESKNDVVFIFENYFEIHEVKKDGKSGLMQKVAVKADLDSSIRSVRIFGSPRQCVPPSPEEIDERVNEEVEDEDHWAALQPEVPPHILVLALDSKMLAFIFAFHDGAGQIRFLQCRQPLPVGRSAPEQLGEFIAVDPQSRAMAVAAHEGFFSLYALKPMDEIRRAVQADGSMDERRFQPVKEERHIQVEGQILQIDFLHPPEQNAYENRVILLLIISKNQRSIMICYEWDSSTRLATASPMSAGQRLQSDERLPLLLVPLTDSTSFMLVSQKRITVYRNILVGSVIAHSQLIRTYDPPEEFTRTPIWTQWARSSRYDLTVQNQDNIYLCREDGLVHFLEIKHGVQVAITIHSVGKLGANIDTSFASIDLGCKGSDLLVLSGDESDGGGWLVEAPQSARKMFVMPNWTSTVDFISTDDPDGLEAYFRQTSFKRDKDRLPKRLFACAGRGKEYGGITEIRFGIQGRIVTNPTLSCPISQIGVTRVWILDGFAKAKDLRFILLSYPTQTSLNMIGENVLENDGANIDLEAATLAAGATSDGLIVQVTQISLRASLYGSDVKSFYQQADVIAACVRVREDEPKALLLLAYFNSDVHFLRFITFASDDGTIIHHSIGIPVQLPDRPTFVSVERVGLDYFAFVGTVSAALYVFHIHVQMGLSPVSDYKFEGTVAICDSVAVLDSISICDRRHFLVCGLRNGCLEVLRWDQKPSSKPFLVLHEKIEIGNTSITVLADIRKPARAILLCDQKLHTLEQPQEESINRKAPLLVNNIYLVESGNVFFQQGMINAMTQSVSGTSTGLLFCVDDKQAQPASLSFDAEPSMIPRRIALGGTPKRVKYSPELDKLIVLFYSKDTMYLAEASKGLDETHQQCVQYSIAFVDLDLRALTPHPGETYLDSSVVFDQFQPGEIPLGITEWFPLRNNEIYHVFVVNTLRQHPSPRHPSGRIYIFKKTATGTLVVKKVFEKEAPVFALTPYGSHSLLYGCGTDLCLHSLIVNSNSSGWKFSDCIKVSLFSQARHISVREPWVYVSTNGNSSVIFMVVDSNRLDVQFVDEISRSNLFHLTIPQRSLLLTCQTGRMITGLWQPSKGEGTTMTSTVFEARLPGSITRLRRIHPPPWKQYLNSESSVIAVGSTTNGSFFQFNILDESAWRLLAFIQTLALRSPGICPFGNPIEAHRRPLEPSTNSLDMHINGDILRRILERGGERSLSEMMSSQDILEVLLSHDLILRVMLGQYLPHDATLVDYSQDHRTRVATEIAEREMQARQRAMWKFAQGVGLAATNEKDLVAKVVHWMIFLMQKVV